MKNSYIIFVVNIYIYKDYAEKIVISTHFTTKRRTDDIVVLMALFGVHPDTLLEVKFLSLFCCNPRFRILLNRSTTNSDIIILSEVVKLGPIDCGC